MSQNNTKALISMISGIVGWSLSILIFCFNSTFGLILAVVTWGLGSICLAPLTCIPPFGWLVAVVTGHLALAGSRVGGAWPSPGWSWATWAWACWCCSS